MTEDDQFDFCEDIMDRFGIKEEDDNNSEWE
jgi:ribosome assembly protein YihI (activator of Der GTPase)